MLGFGALHRIPASLEEPPQEPGETLFETARLSSDVPGGPEDSLSSQHPPRSENATPQYLIPAEMNLASPSPSGEGGKGPPPPSAGGRRKQHHTSKAPAMDMDAYFQEGEAKSKEDGFVPSGKPGAASTAPPPPKAGAKPAEESEVD